MNDRKKSYFTCGAIDGVHAHSLKSGLLVFPCPAKVGHSNVLIVGFVQYIDEDFDVFYSRPNLTCEHVNEEISI